ncbi:MAG: acetyl-CoA carboxylase biotin carboxyl carrier protein [Pyrinomonadaceae bacterium]
MSNSESHINLDELRELVELITSHGLTDFELEHEGFRIRLRRDLLPQQQISHLTSDLEAGVKPESPANTVVERLDQPASPGEGQDLHVITSLIVGTLYRASSPTSESFIEIGSHVNPDTVVCIIEAMKLMNEIQAEVSGEVIEVYVENGQAVEFGQPLFGIRLD